MRRSHPFLVGLAALITCFVPPGGYGTALAAGIDSTYYPGCPVAEYGQCGGIGYTGPKCCPSGWACHRTNEWYSQCRQKLDDVGCTNAEWAQCGGREYEGETCCVKGTYCRYDSQWWSSCASKKTTSKPSHYPSTKTSHSHKPTHTPPPPPPHATVINKPEELRLSPDWNVHAPPQVREYWFEISEMAGAIDGCELVVNGQYPGPLIEVNNGDTLVVHVTNRLSQAVTIHWHGLFQNGTQWQDGPSGVTQCPIRSGVKYTYRFPVTGELQYGTYWWHAHRRALYVDGITGPLIVHSRDDPLVRGRDFDIDQIVMLHDHYHQLSEVITEGLLTPEGFNGSAVAPSPKSNVINGRGLYNCSFAPAGEMCRQLTQSDMPELRFPPNKRVRLRFIHEGAHPPFRVSVDEHELLVIEADDTPVHASPAHRIQIASLPFPDLDPQARVVIRIGNEYDHLGSALPTSVDWNDPTTGACTELEAASLSPLIARRAPSKADHIRVFNSSLAVPNGIFRWTLNDVTFENFAFDPLLQRVQRGEPIPPMRVAVVTAGLEVIDVVIQNVLGADHPFHLHNSPMFVLSSGPGLISPEEASQLQHNLTNPLRRDTITVAPGTWQVVRIITDIPGCLLFHCHIVFHQVQGLLGVLLVQEDRIRSLQIPQDNVDLCRGGNMSMIDPGRKRALPRGPVSLGLSVA
ncbi:hypothetical protein JCM3774_003538 [Rhodotorula dairenensis]